MASTITVHTLSRAFTGVIGSSTAASFARTGADYRGRQNSNSWLQQIKNWLADIVTAGGYSVRTDDEISYKEKQLNREFLCIAEEILKAERGEGGLRPIEFQVGAERFTIQVSNDGKRLRLYHGTDSVELQYTLPELKSAMLKAYLSSEEVPTQDGRKSLAGFDLSGMTLFGPDLRSCDFSQAKLNGTSFVRCDLSRSTFRGNVNLRDSIFYECTLTNAIFVEAHLQGAYFGGANTILTNAQFIRAQLTNAVFMSVNATGANFSEAHFNDARIRMCIVTGANFTHTDFSGTYFDQVDATGLVFIGGANFSNIRGNEFIAKINSLRPLRTPQPPVELHGDSTNLKSKKGFLAVLDPLLEKFSDLDPEVDIVLGRLLADINKIGDAPTSSDWAKVSLALEKLLLLLNTKCKLTEQRKRVSETDRVVVIVRDELEFLKKCVGHLEFVSRVAWAELAHQAIVDDLAAYYEKLWDFAHSDFTTTGASLGITALEFLTIGLGYNYRSGTVVDDEGFSGHAALHTVEVSAKAGVDIGGFGAEGSLKGSYSKGLYREWNNAKHYVADNFTQIVSTQNLAKRKILGLPGADLYKRHLTRSSTLGIEEGSDSTKPEMTEFQQLVENYETQKGHISQFFSVYLSTLQPSQSALPAKQVEQTDPAVATVAATQAMASGRIKLESSSYQACDPFKADMSVLSVKAAGVIGEFDSYASSRTDRLNVKMGAGAEAAYQKVALAFVRYKSPIQKMRELHKANSDGAFGEEIGTAHQKLQTTSNTMWERLNLKWNHFAEKRIGAGVPTKSTPTMDSDMLDELQGTRLALLERDFMEYARLQRQMSYGDVTTRGSLDAFHKLYGVKNKEEFIACLITLNAALYSAEMQKDEGTRDAAFIGELVGFEKTLQSPSFTYDTTKVKKLCFFKDDAELSTSDKKLTFQVALPSAPDGGTQVTTSISVSVQIRKRIHHNIFRAGDYVDISIDGGIALEPDVMGYIADAMKKHADTRDIADYLRTDNGSVLGKSFIGGQTFTIRYYKPAFFPALGYRCLFRKFVNHKEATLGGKLPTIPVAPGVGIKLAASVDKSKTSLSSIAYSSSTFFHFALVHIHEFASEKAEYSPREFGDADVGQRVIPESCYWNTVKREQRAVLEKLFAGVNSESEMPGTLITELNQIHEVLAAQSGAEGELAVFGAQKARFIEAVKGFCAAGAKDKNKEALYLDAVKEMENLFILYHPHIQMWKGQASVYTEREFDISHMDSVIRVDAEETSAKAEGAYIRPTEIRVGGGGYGKLIDEEEVAPSTPESSSPRVEGSFSRIPATPAKVRSGYPERRPESEGLFAE